MTERSSCAQSNGLMFIAPLSRYTIRCNRYYLIGRVWRFANMLMELLGKKVSKKMRTRQMIDDFEKGARTRKMKESA